jgi:hypothetical protein
VADGVGRAQSDRLAKCGCSFSKLPLHFQDIAETDVRVRVVGIDFDGPAAGGLRLDEASRLREWDAEILIALGMTGVEANRLSISSDCLFKLALVLKNQTEAVVGRGVIGYEADGLVIGTGRFVQLALSQQCEAEHGMAPGVVGMELDGLTMKGDGGIEGLSRLPERDTPRNVS